MDNGNNLFIQGEWVGPVLLVRYPEPVLDLRPQRIRWFTVTPEQVGLGLRAGAMSLHRTEHTDETAARTFAKVYSVGENEVLTLSEARTWCREVLRELGSYEGREDEVTAALDKLFPYPKVKR